MDGIDFEVRYGTCLGVLGPNGAGKTTTIEILEGLKTPDGGEVEVLGRAWKEEAERLADDLIIVDHGRVIARGSPAAIIASAMSRFDEIRELTRMRVVLFFREPEAIFWVFVFPLVLAAHRA